MKLTPKRILESYFNIWWLPTLVFLVFLGGFTVATIPHWKPFVIIANGMIVLVGIALLGVLAASLWNLVKKRWEKGIINLLLLPVCGVAAFFVFGFLMFASMFGPSEDGFADNLTIPDNIEVSEPKNEIDAQRGGEEDTFQAALMASLEVAGSTDATLAGYISSLARLQEQHPEILRRYLAANAVWRVFEEHGSVFATRRWMIGPEWKFTLHGYHTRRVIDDWSEAGTPDFQSRFTIGLSGKPWWRGNEDTTWLKSGDSARATLSEGNQLYESHCVISTDSVVVEIFEQSDAMERRLTKAALEFVEAEFAALIEKATWETIVNILPRGSIRRGEASLSLRNSFQPGIYDAIIWINPGERGMIYLKAFEVTKGTPLSVDRLKDKSNEWIGWSDNPEELFFSNTHFTIYEGDWGKPYAARFEVWFDPDSGARERMLMSKVFKIEGWQR